MRSLLSNERYTGRARFDVYELEYPAISPPASRLSSRGGRDRTRQRGLPPVNSFGSVMRCSVCGGAMSKSAVRSRYGRTDYYCCWRSHGGIFPSCLDRKHYPADALETGARERIVDALTHPKWLMEVM